MLSDYSTDAFVVVVKIQIIGLVFDAVLGLRCRVSCRVRCRLCWHCGLI